MGFEAGEGEFSDGAVMLDNADVAADMAPDSIADAAPAERLEGEGAREEMEVTADMNPALAGDADPANAAASEAPPPVYSPRDEQVSGGPFSDADRRHLLTFDMGEAPAEPAGTGTDITVHQRPGSVENSQELPPNTEGTPAGGTSPEAPKPPPGWTPGGVEGGR